MERVLKPGMCVIVVVVVIMTTLQVPLTSRAQISTPCTTSMITSFTPCLNLVTGSSSNGTSPTASCCGALKDLVATTMDCACLLLTANVPIQLPFGGPLSISLPSACNMAAPLRCKASGSPLPAPGPAILAPSAPPSPQASVPVADAPAPDSTVSLPPEVDNPTNGAPPIVNTSATVPLHNMLPATHLIAMAILGIGFNSHVL